MFITLGAWGHRLPRGSPRKLVWSIFLALLLSGLLLQVRSASLAIDSEDDENVAGPVVRAKNATSEETAVPSNVTVNGTDPGKKKTIAQQIDALLVEEFPEDVDDSGKNYNETSKQADVQVETVIRVVGNKQQQGNKQGKQEEAAAEDTKKSEGSDNAAKDKPLNATAPTNTTTAAAGKPTKERKRIESSEMDVDRIIDAQDNEYVLSKPKGSNYGLTLDPQLIRDLTVLISASTVVGGILEALRQPMINGYFMAGSIVGPGGLGLIKELVQVESLAQVGVQLLLFTLGLEFSLQKLRAVRSVALVGGIVEIVLFIVVSGLVANFIGASVHEGIFVGALVSMSSTSIVVKCLSDTKANNSPHGQITIGTLILQDCLVGLLFAFMPVLASNNNSNGDVDRTEILLVLLRVSASLGSTMLVATMVARTVLPVTVRYLAKHTSEELYQLIVIAFCLVAGGITGHMGLSTELGAFMAGVMLSATEQQEATLHALEPIKHFFLSLFVSSTGLVMSPSFLLHHLPVLTGGVILTIASKTILISFVVAMFGYPKKTALAVGLGLAQIGEFAFVLLSVASQLGLMPYQVYMLLMGITALSLLMTPFLLQIATRLLLVEESTSTLGIIKSFARAPPRRTTSEDSNALLALSIESPTHSEKWPNSLEHRGSKAAAGGVVSKGSQYPSEVQLQNRGHSFL